jgi:thiol-disulfide isomerase/thioredoxin
MSGLQVGPFAFDASRLAFVVAAAVFFVVFEIAAFLRAREGKRIAAWATPAAVAWLVVARAGYVLQNWDVFGAHPLDILKVWQGGISVRAGLAGIGVVVVAAIARKPSAVTPLLGAVAVAWVASQATLNFAPDPARGQLPTATFETMSGQTTRLDERDGKPLVLNLWATWCPPCRREMPMMMEMAEATPAVDVAFANQGEAPERIRRFLDLMTLDDAGVVVDPGSLLMHRFAAMGLPTTLFFDRSGALTGVHFGEISRAEMALRMAGLASPEE